jgi:rhodanese-related sulfurtransferase
MRFGARVAVIVAAAAALGLGWNAWSGRGFALTTHAFFEAGDTEIPVDQARARLDRGALFLDARGPLFYDFGHIPGALNLPEDRFEEAFQRLEPRLRQALDVIVYCSGFGCEASHLVSRKLKERGIPAVILTDGWPAWTEGGHPVKEGPQP